MAAVASASGMSNTPDTTSSAAVTRVHGAVAHSIFTTARLTPSTNSATPTCDIHGTVNDVGVALERLTVASFYRFSELSRFRLVSCHWKS